MSRLGARNVISVVISELEPPKGKSDHGENDDSKATAVGAQPEIQR
jgi:hypothetical protein